MPFNIICFVDTWTDLNDILTIEGFTDPFTVVQDKHTHAWRNSGGTAVFLKHGLEKYCLIIKLPSLSNTRNVLWLKFDFKEMIKGVSVICGFTYSSQENSSVHVEEDLFQIIEEDIAWHRANCENHCIMLKELSHLTG